MGRILSFIFRWLDFVLLKLGRILGPNLYFIVKFRAIFDLATLTLKNECLSIQKWTLVIPASKNKFVFASKKNKPETKTVTTFELLEGFQSFYTFWKWEVKIYKPVLSDGTDSYFFYSSVIRLQQIERQSSIFMMNFCRF